MPTSPPALNWGWQRKRREEYKNSAGLPTNQYHYEERAKQHLCGGCQSAGQWPDKLLCACKHWETVPVENDAHISTSPELTVAKEAEKGIQKQCWASHKSISLWRDTKQPSIPPIPQHSSLLLGLKTPPEKLKQSGGSWSAARVTCLSCTGYSSSSINSYSAWTQCCTTSTFQCQASCYLIPLSRRNAAYNLL